MKLKKMLLSKFVGFKKKFEILWQTAVNRNDMVARWYCYQSRFILIGRMAAISVIILCVTCTMPGLRGITGKKRLKLMSFNICKNGFYVGGDRRQKIASIIRKHNPDVVCIQEGGSGPFWSDFANNQGYCYFKRSEESDGRSVLSKTPVLRNYENIRFDYVQIQIRRKPLGIYNVHLPWRVHEDYKRLTVLKKVKELMAVHADYFVCIVGDFNSRTKDEWGLQSCVDYMSRRSGLSFPIDSRGWVLATSFIVEAGFVDCYRTLNRESGYTYHAYSDEVQSYLEIKNAWKPLPGTKVLPAGARIDYIYANTQMAKHLRSCMIDNSKEAYESSDHLPVVALFEF